MTRDDIIRMAREAQLPACHSTHPVALGRFAALVAANEREACAQICEGWLHADGDQCASAIRARGEK